MSIVAPRTDVVSFDQSGFASECPSNSVQEFGGIDRLGERRVSTHGLGHIELVWTRPRDRDDRWSWGQGPEHGDKLQAMDFGHLKIRNDDLDRVATVFGQSFFAVFSVEDLVIGSFEDGAQDDPICFVIVDDENACHDAPGHFDQALRTLLDRMVKDRIEPDTSLERAVASVAYLYATIGGRAGSSD